MNRFAALLVLVCLALFPVHRQALAQQPPEERPRHTITLPPGFELVDAGGVKVICEPADRPAIESTLAAMSPATRPTTMPAALAERLASVRADVLQQVAKDYTITDTKPIEAHLDRLAADLDKLEHFQPPLFYLCTNDARLKSMLKNGEWTTPEIYYNKLADELVYRESVPLTVDRPMDDTVVAAIVAAADGSDALALKLQKLVAATRGEVERMVSGRAMFLVQAAFIDAVMKEVFEPMKMPFGQQWLGVGASGVTSADYASEVIGSPRHELLLMLSAELRRNPVRMRTIDLLHPAEPDAIRREYAAAYADAYRRKSMRAAGKIIEAGREKLPLLVSSLRETPCASGEEMVKRIREVTGVDLASDVSAQ